MPTLSVRECVRFGWETFKKRPWFFIGVALVLFIADLIISTASDSFGETGVSGFVGFLVNTAASMLLTMGLMALFLKAHDSVESTGFSDMWHPRPFWKFTGATILYTLVVAIPSAPFFFLAVTAGMGSAVGPNGNPLLLIVLALIAAAIAMAVSAFVVFTPYLVVDKGLGPVAALKESLRITKGNRKNVFMLLLANAGISILGAMALVVGLLVAIPVVILSMTHAYRTLEHKANEMTPVA